ncbi:MAG: patatin-like phospholipase family protein, partial [Acetobacteraceae bacterium]|nr:patatin-like phospholipase family protein [Acetobacteraceae bacterium]
MADSDADKIVSWEQARAAEFELLHGEAPASYAEDAHRLRQSALCLSGGGIRSAAFSLGVLQALARRNLLTRFHYLSTVSGGGYIGSWLQVLMQQEGTAAAERVLQQENPPQIAWLRQFTSYLTPSRGLLSKDTWAGITLYVRNLILNWLVFLPFFMLLTIAAIWERTTFAQLYRPELSEACHRVPFAGGLLQDTDWSPTLAACPSEPTFRALDGPERWVIVAFGIIAALGLVTAVIGAALMLPSHRGKGRYVAEGTIKWLCVYPSMLWAFFAPLAAAPWFEALTDGQAWQQLTFPFLFWCLVAAAFVLASLESIWARWNVLALLAALGSGVLGAALAGYGVSLHVAAVSGAFLFFVTAFVLATIDRYTDQAFGAYLYNLWPWLCAALAAAFLLWVGERLVALVAVQRRAEAVAVFGPFWLVTCHTFMSAIFVGVRREVPHAELDREWLARLSALKLRIAAMWALFAAATLILSRIGLHQDRAWRPLLSALAAGPAAAWLGKQAMSRLEEMIGGKLVAVSWSLILNVLAAAFAVAVAAMLGLLADEVLALLQSIIQSAVQNGGAADSPSWLVMLLAQAVLILSLGIIHEVDARRINVNRFSMHGVYRNRLIRAFLRGGRLNEPHDSFTNFDDADNPKLHELREVKAEASRCLFPVLGMTLNLTGAGRLDWTERKGASFTATPLHCGAGYAHGGRGAFVDSEFYAWCDVESKHRARATGISLGTAMTISGAAVSPNWGYHSSSLTAFLMTLFNVRLGAWLPNPVCAHPRNLELAKPENVF